MGIIVRFQSGFSYQAMVWSLGSVNVSVPHVFSQPGAYMIPSPLGGMLNWFTTDQGTGRSLSIIKWPICPAHLNKQSPSRHAFLSYFFYTSTKNNTEITNAATATEMAHETAFQTLYLTFFKMENGSMMVLSWFCAFGKHYFDIGIDQVYTAL